MCKLHKLRYDSSRNVWHPARYTQSYCNVARLGKSTTQVGKYSLICDYRDYCTSSLLACKHMYCCSLAQLRVTNHGAPIDKRVRPFWMVAMYLSQALIP